VAKSSEAARRLGVKLFSIGVGDDVSLDSLESVSRDASRVFKIANVSLFHTILGELKVSPLIRQTLNG
jgi:hypothetical protein